MLHDHGVNNAIEHMSFCGMKMEDLRTQKAWVAAFSLVATSYSTEMCRFVTFSSWFEYVPEILVYKAYTLYSIRTWVVSEAAAHNKKHQK